MIYNIFPILFCINQISNNNNFKKDFYYVENKILDGLHKQKQGDKVGSYWSNTGKSWLSFSGLSLSGVGEMVRSDQT